MQLRQYICANYILLSISIWTKLQVESYKINHENHIREILFQRSDAAAQSLPTARKNYPVEMKMAFDILHVISLDEKEQILVIKGVVRMEWEDVGLKWNKSAFDNVDKVSISPKWLWTPDITLYSSANSEKTVINGPCLVSVSSNGKVNWEPPVTIHQNCPVDMWHYPHDQHSCELKFGSWTHDGFSLQLKTFNTTTQKFKVDEKIAEVNEWDVQISQAEMENIIYPCCPEPYPVMKYHIELTRKSAFYHYTLLYPLIAILFLANSVFWLPPNNAEKTSLIAIVCLLLVIITSHLMWFLPNTGSNVPALLGVCASMMFFATLSMFITLITNNISSKTSTPPDFIIRSRKSLFCRFLGTRIHNEQTSDQNHHQEDPLPSLWPSIARGIDRVCFCAYFTISLVFIGLFYA